MKKKLASIIFLFLGWSALSQTTSLNSGWAFVKQSVVDVSELNREDLAWESINLPHTYNNLDAHDETRGMYMGEVWYKKSVYIESTTNNQLFLKFEGVNQVAEVYVNNVFVGEHKGGYTAFVLDITAQVTFDKLNDIVVKVDNTVNKHIPPLSADFTFYGGIYRDVFMIRKNDAHFDILDGSTKGVYVSQQTTVNTSEVSIRTKLINSSKANKKTLHYKIYNAQNSLIAEKHHNIHLQNSADITQSLKVKDPILWSPDSPYLYTVVVSLTDKKGNIEDEFIHKIGLRWFNKNEDGSFSLNGNVIKLIGANRHQDFEGLGNALSNGIHYRDIKLLKDMGANFIRIAHYPQDPAILEACDALGILAWEEIPMVNYITVSDEFNNNSETMLKEMIRQHYNHSSVIMWGFMNEILLRDNKGLKANPEYSKEEYYRKVNALAISLNKTCKTEDPHRLTTIAHHASYDKYEEAGLNEITDIVGWNIYYGWYGADFSRLGKFLDEFHQKHPTKGIIIAEYGAGSDPRLHATTPKRFDFTEEWQVKYHQSYFEQFKSRTHVMGAAIWNFVDFGSEGRGDAVPRINSKGLVTTNRTPKDAYFYYKAALTQNDYLKIGNVFWRNRTGFSNNGILNQSVHIYSNKNNAELILNGQSLGQFSFINNILLTDIPFRQGKNTLMVTSGNVIDFAEFNVSVYPLNLNSLQSKDIDLRMNIGSHVYFHDTFSNQTWLPEQEYQKNGIGYIDGIQLKTKDWKVGVGSEILGSPLEPVYQTHRDEITGFKADIPEGWYEVTLHFAEIYAKSKREKLANNLNSDGEQTSVNVDREFDIIINEKYVYTVRNLEDFRATPIKTRVFIKNSSGLHITFKTKQQSSILSGIEIKGL